MRNQIPFFVTALLLLAACNSGPPMPSQTVSPEIRDRIALCGAGVEVGFSANLEASIGESLQEFGSVQGEALSLLRASFFADADPSDATVAQSFQRYLTCVERPL